MAMWQDDYLLEIRKIDRDQSPHGLYGLREVLSPGEVVVELCENIRRPNSRDERRRSAGLGTKTSYRRIYQVHRAAIG